MTAIEKASVDYRDRPTVDVIISDCGELKPEDLVEESLSDTTETTDKTAN